MFRPLVLLPFNRPSKLFELSDVAQIIQGGEEAQYAETEEPRGSHEQDARRNYCPHIKQGTLKQIAVRMCDGHNDLGHDYFSSCACVGKFWLVIFAVKRIFCLLCSFSPKLKQRKTHTVVDTLPLCRHRSLMQPYVTGSRRGYMTADVRSMSGPFAGFEHGTVLSLSLSLSPPPPPPPPPLSLSRSLSLSLAL
jgi:hypothetical protein